MLSGRIGCKAIIITGLFVPPNNVMLAFNQKIKASWNQKNSLLCVGLDPDMNRIPAKIKSSKEPLFEFNTHIIDATASWVCAFKPQIAYYAAFGAEAQLEKTINYIHNHYADTPVILDAKRGDIGSTARMYAMEAFERYQADAVTVNPYMGGDTLEPFLECSDRGVFILCKTSNPGSHDFQQLVSGDKEIYQHVAERATNAWNKNNNVGLVVGATYPEIIKDVRKLVGEMPLLVPGIGTQGGDLELVLKNGLTANKTGLIINVSRSVAYASEDDDFAKAAEIQARQLFDQINGLRHI